MNRVYATLLSAFMAGCWKTIDTTTPRILSITESVYASGIIKSKGQYEVYSQASGIIEKIIVKEGDCVHKGDVIVTLVRTTPKLNEENARITAAYSSEQASSNQLHELEENLTLMRAQLQYDSLYRQKQRNLWEQGIGSRMDLDKRELAFRNSEAAYKNALLRHDEVKRQIGYTALQTRKNLEITTAISEDYVIRANTSGTVYRVLKEPGEMLTSQTPVAVIGEAVEFILQLQVDEYDITKVRKGQPVYITMDSYTGKVFEGRVTRILPMMEPDSRSFIVEADFISPPSTLYPNLTAEANVLIRTKKDALVIPRSYLQGDTSVLLKSGEWKKVTVGLKDYQYAEVLTGISRTTILKKPAE